MSKKDNFREEIRSGLVIEYLQNNQPITAWVEECSGNRVRAFNINQREVKLSSARILPWTGPAYTQGLSREEINGLLKEHGRNRSLEQEKINILEVWELSQGEIDQARVPWFAGLIWNDPGADRVAALGRAMLQDRARFKFNPPFFEVYPQDIVESRLEQERIARQKEKLISIGREFIKALWDKASKGTALPELENHDVGQQLRELITTRVSNPDDSETSEVWSKLTTGLPADPNLAFILGVTWGIYPPHHNYLLDQAGYVWDASWEQEHVIEVNAIREKFEQEQTDPEQSGFVSIDSATTRDIDDAFIVRKHDDGFLLSLALACPALYWTPDSALDKAVSSRTTSLYLPEGISNMLPGIMAEDLFSLIEKKSRPAMVVEFELNADAHLKNVRLSQKWVRVDNNLTYESVEEQLNLQSSDYLKPALDLAEKLRAARLEKGAVIINQNEPHIRLEEHNNEIRVFLENKQDSPKAQLIVSEFMILANTAMASWAREKSIPLLHRTQDIALPADYSGVWSRPEDIYQVIRSLGATLTETSPKPHRSIAASCYAPVTSPLRRYTDLINELQLLSFIQDGKPYFSFEGLNEMLPRLSARSGQVSQVQRFRPRYWKLVYFRQNCKHQTFQAVVVDNSGQQVVLSLPGEQIMVRAGHDLFGGKTRLGQSFRLRLGKINPLSNEVSVLEAWEE
ncbi:ribonuclease catalytic domain-containing protein [Desulfonatronovibrio magnus]|uniref:ribonuclease catalytic domain-containing protein n=1 Tax=Desulfonatronovibrio magnus TaxID=698827 RepID=UPI0005EBCCC8|nr:ribonuclease catalytic domain-containing protein [Desulfonatronovibrio magnus]